MLVFGLVDNKLMNPNTVNLIIYSISLKIFLLINFSFYAFVSQADSVITHPSSGVINLPIVWEGGHLKISLPKGPPSKRPRIVARCGLADFQIDVLKINKKLSAIIKESKDGVEIDRELKYVYTETVRKELLGQYQVAIIIAQQLGLTEVDYIKIWFLADKEAETKFLIFFYDSDDEIIDRTILVGKRWERCLDVLSCNDLQ